MMIKLKDLPQKFSDALARSSKKTKKKKQKLPSQIKEDDIQKAFVSWYKQQYPKQLIMAACNAGKRSYMLVNYLKAMGMLPGFPDTFIPHARRGYHGLMIEWKRPGEETSAAQDAVIAELRAEGYLVYVLSVFEHGVEAVQCYFGSAGSVYQAGLPHNQS